MFPDESVAIALGVKLSRKNVEYVKAGNVGAEAAKADTEQRTSKNLRISIPSQVNLF